MHFASAKRPTGNSSGLRGIAAVELSEKTQFSGWKLTISHRPGGWPGVVSGLTDQRIGAGK